MRDIARMARARGIQTIVDGAHAFAHFPFKVSDLECDYYGCSLHKWMLAPVGTGFLYVRRENIAKVWPLTPAAASKSDNIRKFEEIGTHPAANHNAIAEALAFHQAIGTERKAARLRYLNDRWAKRVDKLPGVKILNSREPNQAWGLFNVSLERGRAAEGVRVPVVEVPHHHRGDQARRLPGPARHAERLHDARGDRHVRGRDRGSAEERRAVDGGVGTGAELRS